MVEPQCQTLSPDNPWPGLDPFDETDRDYFHGRAVESSELLRLVRRELLTVLFGRSGLGKTSLLKAGLFPRLRDEDYLPVYVRLDHAEGAPPLREQIYRELKTACEDHRAQAADPMDGESLWSFFHRRDAEFWSERNRPVTPVIVLDQFEEIFTLSQETEAARIRSTAFLTELGDLIENRPPDAVKQGLEADPIAARRFDFKRSTVKVVLSFREDFLAEMEGLKERMPSLMYNRFRLLAMSGTQAYEVITRAGGELVDDDVARRIIRLAWKNEPSPPAERSEFPRIEIDPALLSVVCSELNHKRQQAEPPLDRITPDLLEGADREILSSFYERAMAGLGPRVRTFVEDELITGQGYRDSYPIEETQARGITSEALDALIRRRLLCVDERQSVRRLELTHDVLTYVVKESRDSRRARRNRRNAAFLAGGLLMVIVLMTLASGFVWKSYRFLQKANGARLVANADWLQDTNYDTSLLVNLEAIRFDPTLDAQAGLLRRFTSHPFLSTFLPGHKHEVTSVAFSHDGKRLAAASGGAVVLWDVINRKKIVALDGNTAGINSVAFSPDDRRLATASMDNTVIFWDMETKKRITGIHIGYDLMENVYSVTFSPDGNLLAAAGEDSRVILYDLRSKKITALEGHLASIFSVAFSPNSKRLATASQDKTVILWDVESQKAIATLEGQAPIHSVAFSPDGKRLVTGSEDKTVTIWDVDSLKMVAILEGHKGSVRSVAFNPDGKRLASASEDKNVILWDLENRKTIAILEGHQESVYSVAFSPDGMRLASASQDHNVILWDIASRKTTVILEGHEAIEKVAFSPDSKRLASLSQKHNLILWDVNSRTSIANLEAKAFTFSPDGKRLATVSENNNMILWNVDSRKRIGALQGGQSVDFSPDGKQLASASNTAVNLWDVDNLKMTATLEGPKDRAYGVTFSPTGRQLASTIDNKVILWNLDSRRKAVIGEGQWMGFSPNGKRMAFLVERNKITLWDVNRREKIATLESPQEEGHQDAISSFTFSPDNKHLAYVIGFNNIALWDLNNLKMTAVLTGYSFTFGPEGKLLISANDKNIIFWDLDSRKQIAILRPEGPEYSRFALSPDGKRLASLGGENSITLWNLDSDDLMTEACLTANRNLTCDEWRIYVDADKPYHKTCPKLPGPEKCQ